MFNQNTNPSMISGFDLTYCHRKTCVLYESLLNSSVFGVSTSSRLSFKQGTHEYAPKHHQHLRNITEKISTLYLWTTASTVSTSWPGYLPCVQPIIQAACRRPSRLVGPCFGVLGRYLHTRWATSVSCNQNSTYIDTYGTTLHLGCATQKNIQMVFSYFYLLT